jgi:hypothetical protein
MRLPGVARDRERRHFVALIVLGVAPLSFRSHPHCVGDDVLCLRATEQPSRRNIPLLGSVGLPDVIWSRRQSGVDRLAECDTLWEILGRAGARARQQRCLREA